jgi:4-hydroxymandelate oxidase
MSPINLEDYALLAQKTMRPDVWAYFSGGAGNELTLQKNVQAWRDIELLPRPIADMSGGNFQCELLNQKYHCPILIAPMAHQKLAHPDGEIAMAVAASAQECGMVLSTQTNSSMQDVSKAFDTKTNAPLWFQVYLQHDETLNQDLLEQAYEAGYQAIALTIDAPVSGARDRERRAPLTRHVRSFHLQSLEKPDYSNIDLFSAASKNSLTWARIESLIKNSKLPVILKGITHPEDAQKAQSLGIKTLIISNHGGRVLDTMPSTAYSLIKIKDICPSLELLVDGGICRGTDIFKAIALGASAVMVGRPMIYALAAQGAEGVAHALRLLKDELAMTMILCGTPDLKSITRSHLNLIKPC